MEKHEADKYEVLEKIGHGSFGVIRKVRRKTDGYVLCRKEISYLQMSQKEREQLQSELSILKGLRHPNIVAYFEREHIKASSDLHIYMEFCEYGDLARYIRDLKRTGKMADEDFVWSVFTQLITALYRCHYGEDPPEVGRNVIGLSSDAKPVARDTGRAMILHRDLKPENIFLGSDASVKLGDFGLSKIMQSHDFASTYVGTPFYMSPEICAAEQYSLHSDIWAFGCIMYEMCSKEPPFNAKTHLELIQRIRSGKISTLPSFYSAELKDAIARCLRVNPRTRPDTVQLLNIPMVKLKRKELEVVRMGNQIKAKEEATSKALREAERRVASLDTEKEKFRRDLENTVRREWEVKARLEIDRQVQIGLEKLYNDFESEVNKRVSQQLEDSQHSMQHVQEGQQPARSSTPDHADLPSNINTYGYHQSQSTTGEPSDFPPSTDLSELSLESPTLRRSNNSRNGKKTGRTPFARAQTMFEGSPMDVQMAEPSPAPIGSLNLSPRQKAKKPSCLSRNIFADAVNQLATEEESSLNETDGEPFDDQEDDDDDADEVPALPSPTRQKSDPFANNAIRRPGLLRQKTAPMHKQVSSNNLFNKRQESKDKESTQQSRPTSAASKSPSRRLSKLPSSNNLMTTEGQKRSHIPTGTKSPTKPQGGIFRPPSRKREETTNSTALDYRQTAMVNSHQSEQGQMQGRTLVELAQARTNAGINVQDFGEDEKRVSKHIDSWTASQRPKEAAIWDPDTEMDMPSPFIRRAKVIRQIGPGMSGLR